jgi:type I restriction enzyme R subunit
LSPEAAERFEELYASRTLEAEETGEARQTREARQEFFDAVLNMPPTEARDFILKNRALLEILDQGTIPSSRPIYISDAPDELTSHERGYGSGVKPGDYIKEFKAFIESNINLIPALKTVCSRPQELTRESLKSLRLELDSHHFTDIQLRSAWKDLTNQEIAADIIGFIRQQALGSPLLPHEERVRKAVEKLKANHTFKKMELDWLSRIENSLINDTVVDKETFNLGYFRTQGGFARIDKIFGNQLENIILELNEYIYEDGSKTA